MINILDSSQQSMWKQYVERCDDYDMYHTWEYHKISENNKEGAPILFVYSDEDKLIVFPILVREIPDSSYKDATSCYGYVGPISRGDLTQADVLKFQEAFIKYCNQENIIAVFSRLHPLLSQDTILNNLGAITQNSLTITVDLKQTLQEQRAHYRKSTKSEINKLRRIASIQWVDPTQENIDSFMSIYNENMKRVDASAHFFFSSSYYQSLLNATEFNTKLAFVTLEGERIATSLFTFCNHTIQYHLSGTRNAHLNLAPVKLILDEVRLMGTQEGFLNFHLGGGTGLDQQDPLFRFKRAFSKKETIFKTFNLVVNHTAYNDLCDKALRLAQTIDENYFPRYRAVFK